MAAVSLKSIRHTGCMLGAISILFLGGVLWSDRYVSLDPNVTMSVNEAWDAGLIQGFFLLHLLLVVCALGICWLHSWARWVAFLWFPLLAANNIVTEFWHTRSVQSDSWLQATLISAIWLWGLYPYLASREASAVFNSGASSGDA
ncbi:hypothetical protein OS176_13745 [Xanthomonadaceae bacterium XH05]|nr:hypothetical protein [Xanthomonadaceae bacterium XH05]